jgi:hypothetical protein
MWLFWTTNQQLNRVKGGKTVQLACGNCKQTTPYYECVVDEGVKLYSVVEVWKSKKRIMQCRECFAVCDYYNIFPQEKIEAERKTAETKQQESQAKQQAEIEKQRQEALRAQHQEELRRQEEMAARQKREAQRKAEEAQVEDELTELKRQLGKS